jgi:hypothetical protein
LFKCRRGESACADQQCTCTLPDDGRKSRRDLAFGRGNERQQAHAENTGRGLRIGLGKTIDRHSTCQICNQVGRWHHIVQQFQTFSGQVGTNDGDAGEIARGTTKARYHADLDGVANHDKNHRDGRDCPGEC